MSNIPVCNICTKYGTGDSYETPDELYNALHNIFDFKLDAFASVSNAKCLNFLSEQNSALEQDWHSGGSVWMNPPYSKEMIYKCMKHAYEQSLLVTDRYIVVLVRDDPTTKWYDEFIDGKATEVWRLKHRLKFKGAIDSYNFPSCIVIYNEDIARIKQDYQTIYSRWWYE